MGASPAKRCTCLGPTDSLRTRSTREQSRQHQWCITLYAYEGMYLPLKCFVIYPLLYRNPMW